MPLKLGVLGLSDGNGHPYSWSAICNGYDRDEMENCAFPIIPKYLAEQVWPEAAIDGVEVTRIWTQDIELSKHISRASRIQKVCHKPEDMIGDVDAILLARDDAENHLKFAAPFLQAGLPVYIDKPAALSIAQLEELYAQALDPQQIFSCSALRFASELRPDANEWSRIGTLKRVEAQTPKGWDKYAIHIIEPVLSFLNRKDRVVDHRVVRKTKDEICLDLKWSSDTETRLCTLGNGSSSNIQFKLVGSRGDLVLTFKDSFNAFRKALVAFTDHVQNPDSVSDKQHIARTVELVELGRTL